ncbi:spore germination protein KB [Anaerosolibacter carboniphilus]|uniref:Spore germination protein KB n=1 Tax=Anaerosolibacter carboniphilus TaxID=1417629 RepID=A0A841L3F9_9FIRM|nr:endospore germination permease [Anaerosolibacter carboniphilus]MBB6216875.1 spore germination protein KB [Anaerosolibacter carboniphilus]
MNKEVISDKQGITLTILFIWGSSLVIGSGAGAKREVWLAILMGMIGGLLLSLIYARMLYLFPQQNLFDIVIHVFGKYMGGCIIVLYSWFAFHLGALVLRNFGEFIITVALPETPMMVPTALLCFLCIWASKEGVEVLGRWGEVFIVFLGLIMISTLSFSTTEMNINNIRPFLFEGWGPVLKGAFSSLTFPFGETVILLMVFSCLKRRNSPFKTYPAGILIAGLVLTAFGARNILVLGSEKTAAIYFPSYLAVSRIDVAEIFTRLEIVVSVSFIISGLVKISICLMAASRGLAKLAGLEDYRFLVTPVGLLMLNLSYFVYGSIMEMVEWAFKVWNFYAVPFQVILPIIIWIAAEMKIRTKNNKERKT